MPSKTKKQARAMAAAAAGNSNIGIPKAVGQEFAAADARKPKSAKELFSRKKRPAPKASVY